MSRVGAESASRIPSLDGLRAISILFVVLGHGANTATPGSLTQNILDHLGNASLGVSTFFVLSGYLITRLLIEEQKKTGSTSLSQFYLRRSFRILPAFYFFLLVMFACRQLGWIDPTNGEFASAALFVWNYVPWTSSWWLGHTWSLSVEEQFYLCWPLVFLLCGPNRSRNVAAAVVFIEPIIRVASYFLFPAFRGRIAVMSHTRIDTLMFGCWLALAEGSPAIAKIERRLNVAPYVALCALLAHVVLARRFRGTYLLTVGLSIEGLSISTIILWVTRRPRSWLGTALNVPAIAWLGRLSYSLYLWQQVFLTKLNTTIFGVLPLSALAALAVAALSYYSVEQPFLRLRNRLSARKVLRTSIQSEPEDREVPNQTG